MFPFLSAPMFYAALCALIGALCLGVGIHERHKGYEQAQLEFAAARAEQEHEARMFEQARATKLQEIDDVKATELRSITARADALASELRSRPYDRVPSASQASCSGGSGAELSGRDAQFLVGLAARADSLRAELGACQERERAGSRP
jgi:uncharacterized protein HemX